MVADEKSFIIHYRNADGRESVRRITVEGIFSNASGVPILIAYCHQRRTEQCFRIDRISMIADDGGRIIQNPSDFYRERFGLDWPHADVVLAPVDVEQARWEEVRTIALDCGIVLPVAIALADHDLLLEEMGVIVVFVADRCEAEGILLEEPDYLALEHFIRELQPTPEEIDAALDKVAKAGKRAIREILRCCKAVMDADGFQHHREVTTLNAISLKLTGSAII